jgi:hypothetical protein
MTTPRSTPAADEAARLVFLTGSDEIVAAGSPVSVGALTASIDGGALRGLRFGGVELLRRIDFPVRDHNWVTLPPAVSSETLRADAAGFRYERVFEAGEGALACRVVYEGTADGTLVAFGEAVARRDFVTNRTGFTVLHPLEGVAGHPVTVTSPDGGRVRVVLPELIHPSQTVRDIAGLAFDIAGLRLDIVFSGEVFEMEDQRNWSDASFKTYCRPLVEPFAYVIAAGSTVRQEIRVRVGGAVPAAVRSEAVPVIAVGGPAGEAMPELLLAAETGWLPDEDGARRLAGAGLDRLLLRLEASEAAATLAEAAPMLAACRAVDLEILVDARPSGAALAGVADACRAVGLAPAHVMALPATYLDSYQPNGVWPTGTTPREAGLAARAAFAGASIGGGGLSQFTEFNRARPTDWDPDYVTHAGCSIIHAADDGSVMQTLETQPHLYRSARAIGGARPYRLGLVAIGMRHNSYGEDVTANPEQRRLTMARWDPRQRGLFAAAWATGILAAAAGHGVEALALAAPVGPFGLLAKAAPVRRPWYDAHPEAVVHPLFHVLKAAAGGGIRHSVTGAPDGLAALAFATESGRRLLLANVGDHEQTVALAGSGYGAVLDTASFAAAVTDPDWFERARAPVGTAPVSLAPGTVLIFDLG